MRWTEGAAASKACILRKQRVMYLDPDASLRVEQRCAMMSALAMLMMRFTPIAQLQNCGFDRRAGRFRSENVYVPHRSEMGFGIVLIGDRDPFKERQTGPLRLACLHDFAGRVDQIAMPHNCAQV